MAGDEGERENPMAARRCPRAPVDGIPSGPLCPVSIEPPCEPVRGKKLIELAVAMYLYSRFTGDHDSEPVRRVVAALRGLLERPDFADRLMRFPAEFIVVCDVYAVLRLLGHDDPAMRDVFQRAIDAGYVRSAERPAASRDGCPLDPGVGAFRDACLTWTRSAPRRSCPRSLGTLSARDAYALTHVVMFLYPSVCGSTRQRTRWTWRRCSTRFRISSSSTVRNPSGICWAEVLLCCRCVGLRATPVYEQGWEAFLSVPRADGAFPVRRGYR